MSQDKPHHPTPNNPEMEYTPEDLQRYQDVMTEVKLRVQCATKVLNNSDLSPLEQVEYSGLQVRKVLELIAFSTLVNHRTYFEKAQDYLKAEKATKAKAMVKKLNPRYWPEPVVYHKSPDGKYSKEYIKKGFLTEKDWESEYSSVSAIVMHARSPFQPRLTAQRLNVAASRIRKAIAKIIVLTEHHEAWPLGKEQYLLCVIGNNELEAKVYLWKEAGLADTT